MKVEKRDNALFSSFKMESVDPLAVRESVDSMDTVDVSTCPAGARFPPEDYVASVVELGLPPAITETAFQARALLNVAGERVFSASDRGMPRPFEFPALCSPDGQERLVLTVSSVRADFLSQRARAAV